FWLIHTYVTLTSSFFPYTTLFRSPGELQVRFRRVDQVLHFGVKGAAGDAQRQLHVIQQRHRSSPQPSNRIVIIAAGIVIISATADRKSTRLNSSHVKISYAVFCLK